MGDELDLTNDPMPPPAGASTVEMRSWVKQKEEIRGKAKSKKERQAYKGEAKQTANLLAETGVELDRRREAVDRNQTAASDMAAASGSVSDRAKRFEQLQQQQTGFGALKPPEMPHMPSLSEMGNSMSEMGHNAGAGLGRAGSNLGGMFSQSESQ